MFDYNFWFKICNTLLYRNRNPKIISKTRLIKFLLQKHIIRYHFQQIWDNFVQIIINNFFSSFQNTNPGIINTVLNLRFFSQEIFSNPFLAV